ncbi:MAG: ABC transporter permease [Desulfobacterales bacterium]
MSRTYEQASMFGPVSVVIAAALGGIMVPVYVMPRVMQQISHFSPLAWGLTALTDIFVRGGNVKTVLPELLLLLAFFSVNIFIAWAVFLTRGRSGT